MRSHVSCVPLLLGVAVPCVQVVRHALGFKTRKDLFHQIGGKFELGGRQMVLPPPHLAHRLTSHAGAKYTCGRATTQLDGGTAHPTHHMHPTHLPHLSVVQVNAVLIAVEAASQVAATKPQAKEPAFYSFEVPAIVLPKTHQDSCAYSDQGEALMDAKTSEYYTSKEGYRNVPTGDESAIAQSITKSVAGQCEDFGQGTGPQQGHTDGPPRDGVASTVHYHLTTLHPHNFTTLHRYHLISVLS